MAQKLHFVIAQAASAFSQPEPDHELKLRQLELVFHVASPKYPRNSVCVGRALLPESETTFLPAPPTLL